MIPAPGFNSRFRRGSFSGAGQASGSKNGNPVAALPGAWRYRVSAGTGWPESVYCDWVIQKVWSSISVSMWQHVHMSEQTRP